MSNQTLVPILCAALACGCGLLSKKTPPPAEEQAVEKPPSPEVAEPPPPQGPPQPEDPPLGVDLLGGPAAKTAFLANKDGEQTLKKAKNNAKKIEKARALFAEALEKDPGQPDARYNLACALSRMGAFPDAADALIESMKTCYPCSSALDTEPDLEALRASDQWKRVTEARDLYSAAWKRALDAPGAFLLLGMSRMLRNQSWGGVESDVRDRGWLCYYHAPTGRILPFTGRDVAGFVVDRENGKVHALTWARYNGETDVSPTTFGGLAVVTVDLGTLATSRVRITADVSGVGIWPEAGKLQIRYVLFKEEMAEEYWVSATIDAGEMTDRKKGKDSYTLSSMAENSPKQEERFCKGRIEESMPEAGFLFLDGFCGATFPPSHTSDAQPPASACVPLSDTDWLCAAEPPKKESYAYDGQATLTLHAGTAPPKKVLEPDLVVQMAAR